MSKEKAPCKYLSIIILDSVIKANKKHYPQTFLEECKYTQEKIKIYINEDLEDSESDSDSIIRLNLILIMKNNLLKVF